MLGVQAVICGMQWVKFGQMMRGAAAPPPAGTQRSPVEPQPHGINVWGMPVDAAAAPSRHGDAAAITQTGIPGAQQVIAYLIFSVIATLGVGIPVVLYSAWACGRSSCSQG